jgi:hypothetical protein
VDYWEQGITVKELGLEGMNASQIIQLATTGEASLRATLI